MNHDSTTVEPSGSGNPGPGHHGTTHHRTGHQGTGAGTSNVNGGNNPDRDSFGGAPHGFFAWIRGLGLSRQPGWIGGVASGIAARIGIDPVIVRGVFIVFALFAAPVLVFYAAAWLLLPDTDGRIHAQRLLQGDPQPALAGIVLLFLLGILNPFTSFMGYLNVGGFFWGPSHFLFSALTNGSLAASIVNLLVLAGITAFVVWIVRRNNKNSRGGGAASVSQTASASAAFASGANGGGLGSGGPNAAATTGVSVAAGAATDTAPGATEPAGGSAAAAAAATDTASAHLVEPVSPGSAASVDELAAWKLQHEAWRTERERFNAEQANAERAAREYWAAENKARSQEFAALAVAHRRRRKLENPRVSAASLFLILGIALVAGAASALFAFANPATSGYAATIGVLSAAFVASVAMIVAGALRRRSGFLALVAVALTIIGLSTAALPRDGVFLLPSQDVSAGTSGPFIKPLGDMWMYIDRNDSMMPGKDGQLSVRKMSGNIYINLAAGTSLAVNATLANGQEVYITRVVPNEDGAEESMPTVIPTHEVVGPDNTQVTARIGDFVNGKADLTLDAELGAGFIQITQYGE